MKKFLTVALMVVLRLLLHLLLKQNLNISGYQEFYAVSVDQQTAAGLQQAVNTHEC